MTELSTTSSPSVKRQPAGLGKIESYKWKDRRPAGLVQIQAVDTTVLPPPRLRRLTASSSPINIALNWGWMKASLTRIGQLGQQSYKLSLPYTSRPNYSFAPFVVKTCNNMQVIKRSQCIENIQSWSITCITYPAKTHPLYIKFFLGVLLIIDQD